MVDDSLRSLRTLAITSMLIVVVWMLSWQSMNDRLARYGPAAELQSWVDLGERLKNLKVDVFTVDLKESIDWDEMDAPPRAPNFEVGTDRVDLQVVVTWPKPIDYSISLEPVARGKNAEIESKVARVYRVVPRRGGGGARDDRFPWNGYFVLFLKTTDPRGSNDEQITLRAVVPDDCRMLGANIGSRQINAAIVPDRGSNSGCRWQSTDSRTPPAV